MLWASGEHDKQDLAKLIGCPRTRFSAFLNKKGDLSEDQGHDAEQWLRENGFWVDLRKAGNEANETASILAQKLRTMADVLDSKFFDDDHKIAEFSQFIEGLRGGFKSYIAAIKKRDSNG